jgi:glycosyltransferase involved in cell wall biosynthesis
MNIISLVSYPFLPARTGGQKGIALFYKFFSRYHQLTIVTTKKNQPALAEGYELRNIISNSKFRYINPFIFFRIRNLIRQKKATHIILEHPYYGWLGILLKKFCAVQLVVHSHNIESLRWKGLGKWWWRFLWNYEKITHQQADFNFFIQDQDRKYAIDVFQLDEKKCLSVSFGTEIERPPSTESHESSYRILQQQLRLSEQVPLLLLNGSFQYLPNREALDNLLFKINPLLQKKEIPYLILIIGLDIPETIKNASYPNVIVLGFVENLELYLTGCNVFLNPVQSGGGIKTKLVEALAFNLNAVSTDNGAIGIDPALCNGKLIVCPDGDWNSFAAAVTRAISMKAQMPPDFYIQFYWGNITKRAADFISVNSRQIS